MLATKTLKGYPRSVQKIGFLGDGSLYIDAHIFDDAHGDFATTDYLTPAAVLLLKALLFDTKVPTDAEFLDALAAMADTADELTEKLKAQGFRTVHRYDPDAHYDVGAVMPTEK